MNRIGYHLLGGQRKLGYGDGRRVFTGRTYKAKGVPTGGKPAICAPGMHAATTPGRVMWSVWHRQTGLPFFCVVRVNGVTQSTPAKFVGRSRVILWSRRLPEALHLAKTAALKAWARAHGCPARYL